MKRLRTGANSTRQKRSPKKDENNLVSKLRAENKKMESYVNSVINKLKSVSEKLHGKEQEVRDLEKQHAEYSRHVGEERASTRKLLKLRNDNELSL